VVTSVDFKGGEITVLDNRPADKRTAGEPAEKRFKASTFMLSGLAIGDKVKIYLDSSGNEHRVIRIKKIRDASRAEG